MQLYQQHSLFPRKYAIKIHRTNFGKLHFQEMNFLPHFKWMTNVWCRCNVASWFNCKFKNKWKLHYNIKFCTMEFKVILNEINLMNCSKTVNAIGEKVIHLNQLKQNITKLTENTHCPPIFHSLLSFLILFIFFLNNCLLFRINYFWFCNKMKIKNRPKNLHWEMFVYRRDCTPFL